MGKFVVIVLDGFGVGAMPDVPQVRPADCGANTCVHIFERTPDLKLPNLASLGLANIVGREFPGLPFATDATFGRAELMHDGADTFFGHQEIMGTRRQSLSASQSAIRSSSSKRRWRMRVTMSGITPEHPASAC